MTLEEACAKLALANRIIAHEGVLDAFGHVSMRHPDDEGRYLLPVSRSPELVVATDILEFTLDSEPVEPTAAMLYGERVIHGCIYQARPDVNAVCHHHARGVMPFCISGVPLQPVSQLGAIMGPLVPFWDQRDEFGDTDLLVVKPEEGRSLAHALGPYWMVLMRRHGATVVGETLEQMVFRTIYATRNAEMQHEAHSLGHVSPLTPKEAELACAFHVQEKPISRAWEYWSRRVKAAYV